MHDVFRKWFGTEYDIDVIDAVMATAAAERLTGDPLWLLVVSGPGNTKTETVQSLSGAGALRHQHDRLRGRVAVGLVAQEPRQDRDRRPAAPDRRSRRPRDQGRHIDPVSRQQHPRRRAGGIARGL